METDSKQSNKPSSTPSPGQKHWPLHLHLKGVWLIIAAVLLTLGLAYYFGLRSNPITNPPPGGTYSQEQAQVSITKSGFIPATISVRIGTQVTWTNQDTRPHQVAANPYPKNDSIPGFDSTQVLQKSDSYTHTFTKAGTYGYHDQLKPFKLLGTVEVK